MIIGDTEKTADVTPSEQINFCTEEKSMIFPDSCFNVDPVVLI